VSVVLIDALLSLDAVSSQSGLSLLSVLIFQDTNGGLVALDRSAEVVEVVVGRDPEIRIGPDLLGHRYLATEVGRLLAEQAKADHVHGADDQENKQEAECPGDNCRRPSE